MKVFKIGDEVTIAHGAMFQSDEGTWRRCSKDIMGKTCVIVGLNGGRDAYIVDARLGNNTVYLVAEGYMALAEKDPSDKLRAARAALSILNEAQISGSVGDELLRLVVRLEEEHQTAENLDAAKALYLELEDGSEGSWRRSNVAEKIAWVRVAKKAKELFGTQSTEVK